MNIYVSIGAWILIIGLFIATIMIKWYERKKILNSITHIHQRDVDRASLITTIVHATIALVLVFITIVYPIIFLLLEFRKWI